MDMPIARGRLGGQSAQVPGTISRYAAAAAALRGHAASLSAAATGPYFRRLVCRVGEPAPAPEAMADLLSEMRALILVYADGRRHERLKRLIRRTLSPRVAGAAPGIIDETVRRLLDRVSPLGRMDVVRDVAGPLPAVVIARLLGLPEADGNALKRWSTDLAAIVGPVLGPPEQLARAQQSAAELHAYLRTAVAARRAHPQDDLISDLTIHGERTGLIESEDELIANIAFLLVAGHESTAGLIASGVLLLLQHPDELARVAGEPGLLDGAVRETLRLESPVQMVARVTADGRRRPVRILLGQANRDPSAYRDPDRFDTGRYRHSGGPSVPAHLAFGVGEHRCLGATLAMMEARGAIGALARRCPALALDADRVEWRDSRVFRSLTALPVTFRPAERGSPP